MNEFKSEFKSILKQRLYWLFICVFLLIYVTEVIPEINLYGPQGRKMDFSTACQANLMDMAYTNTKISYDYGYVNRNKYFLGLFYIGHEEVHLTYEAKNDMKKLLDEFKEGTMSYPKYRKEIDRINNELPKNNYLGVTYTYNSLISDKPLDTSENYEIFRSEVTDIMKTTNFSKFTSNYFADIAGMELALFTIFIVAFIYKRKKVNLMAYYAALTSNIFLFMIILAIVTYFVTLSIGKLYNWPVQLTDFIEPLFVWLLPSISYITAETILLSVLVKNGYISVFIQYLYSITFVSFDIKLSSFIIRCNSSLYKGYAEDLSTYSSLIYANRLIYIILTILFIYLINVNFKCQAPKK